MRITEHFTFNLTENQTTQSTTILLYYTDVEVKLDIVRGFTDDDKMVVCVCAITKPKSCPRAYSLVFTVYHYHMALLKDC